MKENIRSAIAAHGRWKARLKTAIDTGKIDIPVEVVEADDQCAFGEWLKSLAGTPEAQNSPHYSKCKELHAQFHKVAAKVVRLALAGNVKEAEQMMANGGQNSITSAALTRAMMDWEQHASGPSP